ncbi:MAG TPA: chorismate synthase [Bacteroidia bacterium]|jgi:chorismate synthase|nr:chorismate synthase [Bacteroidia bacterium]HQF27422.1 chorismate synthase [Bacteroidia bacterium]
MAGNTIGSIFRVTTFGESHGPGIGVVIDGCPAGLTIDNDFIGKQLSRRRPGQSAITTARNEDDNYEILSGVFEGKTTGAPLSFFIKNKDVKSQDYSHLQHEYRPSHADYTYDIKYGHRDYRGGGRSSARETAARVIAGSVAQLILQHYGIRISAYVSAVGNIKTEKDYLSLDLSKTDSNAVRCPDESVALQMENYIKELKASGDTIGGIISCVISGAPVGLGEPVFDKLHADLGKAMLSINAAKGFDLGKGFDSVGMKGSEHNDVFAKEGNKVTTLTNNSGGIQGGISNGEDIYFRVAFKPIATLLQKQKSINDQGQVITLEGKGRHDPCVLPRAVPIVEAMAAIVLADHLLRDKATKL